jgi:hypothetical protein
LDWVMFGDPQLILSHPPAVPAVTRSKKNQCQ